MNTKELLEQLEKDLAEYVRTAPQNYVSEEMALCPEDLGQRLYDSPILAVGSADDSLWEKMKEPGVVGPNFRTPKEWMPQARTVISYFAPFSDYVVDGNKIDPVEIGHGWLYARVDGQKFLTRLNHWLEEWAYTGVYEYCINCGACTRCPAGAISVQEGKDLMRCTRYFDYLREKYAPRFGCGKCYVHTPCERGIPEKNKY